MIFIERVGGLLPLFDAFVQRLNERVEQRARERFELLLDGLVPQDESRERRADLSRGALGVRGRVGDALKGIEKQTERADRCSKQGEARR